MTNKVLIVDPETFLAEALAQTLEDRLVDGSARITARLEGFYTAVSADQPDLVIISSAFKESDPFDLCREASANCPVLLIARDTDSEVVLIRTLEAQGLGVLSPDVGVTEMVRTVEAALRGEACVPRGMLGGVLRHLVERRRADKGVLSCYSKLTTRERQILLEMAQGKSIDTIATDLVLSRSTIRTHAQHVLDKLEVHSRAEAVDMALEHGLVNPRTGEVHP